MFSFVSSLRRRFTTAALSSKYVQDMPPPGGFPIIDISKRLPGPRMSGAGLFLLLGLVMAYGKYYTYEGAAILHTWKDEKRAIRAVVYPFMQAEYDIRFLQKQAKFHEFERRVMEGVEGWEVGKNHYHTTWMHYNPGFGAWRKPFTGRV
jgi:NADH dehydrogenase (ubiquinone) 1 alpha subcomplex subunit 13